MNCSVRVVVVPTKVIKFLLITTRRMGLRNAEKVVVVPTKVIKFLLITTISCGRRLTAPLLLYLQR